MAERWCSNSVDLCVAVADRKSVMRDTWASHRIVLRCGTLDVHDTCDWKYSMTLVSAIDSIGILHC